MFEGQTILHELNQFGSGYELITKRFGEYTDFYGGRRVPGKKLWLTSRPRFVHEIEGKIETGDPVRVERRGYIWVLVLDKE